MNALTAFRLLEPPAVVTVTKTVPLPGGETAVSLVFESALKDFAFLEPKCTAVTLVKPEPKSVTTVPPVVGPATGEIRETAGGALVSAGACASVVGVVVVVVVVVDVVVVVVVVVAEAAAGKPEGRTVSQSWLTSPWSVPDPFPAIGVPRPLAMS